MSDITEKWGREVAQRGFAQIPNYLLLLNQFLDDKHRLTPVDLLVLLQLVGTWWRKESMPFPSMRTLAIRCGVSERQIQRAVNKLVKVKLLDRISRRSKGMISSNAYDLAPLVSLLGEIAKAFPNEYPRNVDKAVVKAISSRLEPQPEQLKEQQTDDPQSEAQEQLDETAAPASQNGGIQEQRQSKRLTRIRPKQTATTT